VDLTPEAKAHIDGMPYVQLLLAVRCAPVGDPWFQGETGDYWLARMRQLRAEGADHVSASKAIGGDES